MTHLYLIRHGDSVDGLADGKSQDMGLSPEGISQAEKLRDRLAKTDELKPDVLISSPERRAYETALILEPVLRVPIMLDKDVEEWRSDDGSLSQEEFMAQWNTVPKSQKPFYRWIEGYENRMEFMLRVNLSMNRILQEHAGKSIVVVTHGAFIQSTFNFFFGYGEASLERASPDIKRTSITHWHNTEGSDRWILERSNDYYHLLTTL